MVSLFPEPESIVLFDKMTIYAEALPYLLFGRPDLYGRKKQFHMSAVEFYLLSRNYGYDNCYAYCQKDNKWAYVTVSDYWIESFEYVDDAETLKWLESEARKCQEDLSPIT